MKNLAGRIAVITGAANGIGSAIAKKLNQCGAFVNLVDINDVLSNDLPKDESDIYVCDIASKRDVEKTFSDIIKRQHRIDILINNAGITQDAMFHKMTDEKWENIIRVNINGIYNCCRSVIDSMRIQNYGKIVSLSSVSAFGNIGQTNYGMSKAAVIGFTKCLAKEVACHNITVNAIAPSYVDTDMLHAIPEKVMQQFLSIIPMGRLARPEEIASVAAFLSSDESSFITGECIVVSGGSYM